MRVPGWMTPHPITVPWRWSTVHNGSVEVLTTTGGLLALLQQASTGQEAG